MLGVVDQMDAGKHSLVQYSANEDSVEARSIQNDVPHLLETPISWLNSIAGAADLRSFGKPIEAGFQAIEIALGLFRSPGVHGVVGNIYQIESGQVRKLVCGQPSHPALCQSALSDMSANLTENVTLGYPALLTCQNRRAQGIELGFVFFFNLFQCPQARTKHFARIRVVTSFDSAVDKFVHLWCKVDVARRHGTPLV